MQSSTNPVGSWHVNTAGNVGDLSKDADVYSRHNLPNSHYSGVTSHGDVDDEAQLGSAGGGIGGRSAFLALDEYDVPLDGDWRSNGVGEVEEIREDGDCDGNMTSGCELQRRAAEDIEMIPR